MKVKYIYTLFLMFFILNIKGQSTNKEVLFEVVNTPVYSTEFLRVFNKNKDLIQEESQKTVDEYLKLFINYKLKIEEAKRLELHKKPSYIKELANYKKQLAKNYIADSKVTDKLMKEAYERMLYEVKAHHILVKIDENAVPKDTLLAYNKIVNLRDRALKEGFNKVRAEVHNGKTLFGEKLGYFGGFKMVYKFESAAFNTHVGEVSKPFRTRFGYHIVNVLDKRKSKGVRTVGHIMIKDTLAETSELRIQDIYKKINQGEAFESLAKQFSEDKNSASQGGKLKPFSEGELRSKAFEDITFSLEHAGNISKPFKTNFGWHIVKLYNKKMISSYEAMKPELIGRIKQDIRSKLIDEAFINKLKSKYNLSENQPDLSYFVSILNNDYFERKWNLPVNFKEKQALIRIGEKQFTYKDLGDYIFNSQYATKKEEPLAILVVKKYEAFLSYNLIKYEEEHLELENEDYANIVAEYRDGLLLFDLMETTIWNTTQADSMAIKQFYETKKSNYIKPKGIEAVVASSVKKKTLKKVSKLLKNNVELDKIKSMINTNNTINVVFKSGIMRKGDQALPKEIKFEKGVSKIQNHNGAFIVVHIKRVLPEEQKTFKESKGAVISDYQKFKEEKWLKGLKAKYPIKINSEALKSIKTQFKN